MNKECPNCHRFTVKYDDDYFKRDRCMMRDCSWIEPLKGMNNKLKKGEVDETRG